MPPKYEEMLVVTPELPVMPQPFAAVAPLPPNCRASTVNPVVMRLPAVAVVPVPQVYVYHPPALPNTVPSDPSLKSSNGTQYNGAEVGVGVTVKVRV